MRIFVFYSLAMLLCTTSIVSAQNVNFRVDLNYEKIAARTDVRIMENLKTYMYNFINNTNWVKEEFDKRSEVTGSILITLESVNNNYTFAGFLNIQAERLIFNTSYQSTLFNFRDNDIQFEFGLNQIDNFNENNFMSTSNPLQVNLPAILAFYMHLILGLDADSYGLYKGSKHFNIALQIATNAASNTSIAKGWAAFENNTNRFMLIKELTTEQYKNLHVAFYKYYRHSLDQLYQSKETAISGMVAALSELEKLKIEKGYTLHLYIFMNTHKSELLNMLNYVDDPKYKSQILQTIKKLS